MGPQADGEAGLGALFASESLASWEVSTAASATYTGNYLVEGWR